MDYETTGLPWVNPSPNMRNLNAAFLYPGSCLPEGSNMSVGRGTDWPFEVAGAPWLDDEKLVAELREASKQAGLDGIRYESCEFTPAESKFKNEKCFGVRFFLDDDPESRRAFMAVRFGIVLTSTLHKLYPETWDGRIGHLLLHDKAQKWIMEGRSISEIEAGWQKELERFEQRRENFLLYQ